MPRSKDYIYIPVPVVKNGRLHKHLKEEAARVAGKSDTQQVPVGPYILDLLEDRDRALYNKEESELWFSTSTPHLTSLIETTVQKVMSSLPTGNWQTSVNKPVQAVEENTEEEIEAQAAALVASWGDDDDE